MARIRVAVVDEDGNPRKGVTVAAYSLANFPTVLQRVTTDKSGSASFDVSEPAFYDAFDRRGVSFRDRSYAGKVQIQIVGFGNIPCYDYVVDPAGFGTHTTLPSAFSQAVTDNARRSIWVCGDHTLTSALNITGTTTSIVVTSAGALDASRSTNRARNAITLSNTSLLVGDTSGTGSVKFEGFQINGAANVEIIAAQAGNRAFDVEFRNVFWNAATSPLTNNNLHVNGNSIGVWLINNTGALRSLSAYTHVNGSGQGGQRIIENSKTLQLQYLFETKLITGLWFGEPSLVHAYNSEFVFTTFTDMTTQSGFQLHFMNCRIIYQVAGTTLWIGAVKPGGNGFNIQNVLFDVGGTANVNFINWTDPGGQGDINIQTVHGYSTVNQPGTFITLANTMVQATAMNIYAPRWATTYSGPVGGYSGGLGSINVKEDTATVLSPTQTLDFTEPDNVLVSGAGTTATIDMRKYASLAGRSGGQTLNGGTLASQNLTLVSTANATKGKILFGTSGYDEVNNRLGIGTASPGITIDNRGSEWIATYLRVGASSAPTNTTAGDLTVSRFRMPDGAFQTAGTVWELTPADSAAASDTNVMRVLTAKDSSAGAATTLRGMEFTVQDKSASGTQTAVVGFQSLLQHTGAGTLGDGSAFIGKIQNDAGTSTALNAFRVTAGTLSGTVTTARGFYVSSNLGAAAVGTAVGVDIVAQSGAANNFGIRNADNLVQTKYARFGAITAPSNVTDGDVNMLRLFVGANAAILSGLTAQVAGVLGISANNTLRLYDSDNSNFIAFRADSARTTDITYVWPVTDPTAGQILSASAPSGGVVTLTWAADATGGGGGSGHTIRENGVDQTARTGLNFVDTDAGAGLIVDDAGNNETEVHLDLYALLAGRSGGQTIAGGTAGTQSLTLKGNSSALDGTVVLGSTAKFVLDETSGQLRLPTTGSSAGLLVGGDVQLYRVAADVWASPDSLRVGGYATIGSTSAPTNTTAGDVTAIRLLVGTDAAYSTTRLAFFNAPTFVPTGSHAIVKNSGIVGPDGVGSPIVTVGLQQDLNVRPTANHTGFEGYGLSFNVNHDTGVFNLGSLYGVQGNISKTVGGTVTTAATVRGVFRPQAGTISDAFGIDLLSSSTGDTGTIGNYYGVYVRNKVAGVTMTNQIGINIEALSGATTNMAIRTLGGHHRFVEGLTIGADATPAASSLLDVTSTAQGVLLSRMTKTQRDAIASPATSLLLFNTTGARFNYYDSANWKVLTPLRRTFVWYIDGRLYMDKDNRQGPIMRLSSDLGSWQPIRATANLKTAPTEGSNNTGTATSTDTTSTLVDSGKTWTTNQWAGAVCSITGGTNNGKKARILSNTATKLTFIDAFAAACDNTSVYSIQSGVRIQFEYGTSSTPSTNLFTEPASDTTTDNRLTITPTNTENTASTFTTSAIAADSRIEMIIDGVGAATTGAVGEDLTVSLELEMVEA